MGSGIAMSAALSNFKVILFDLNPNMLISAKKEIDANLDFLIAKRKLTGPQKQQVLTNITFTFLAADCVTDLVIEAIVEELDVKIKFFQTISSINKSDTIFASNTSSFSITLLQQNIPNPARVAGMHFFNPAHIMKLVEVVKGEQTDEKTIELLFAICSDLKKLPVRCSDSPGFIVNRVARHYYLEAMNLVENNISDIESIDQAMESMGFKLGPFKLMDLIGLDINYLVSESIYNAFNHAARFQPSDLQRKKILNKELGKKTGKGFYDYTNISTGR